MGSLFYLIVPTINYSSGDQMEIFLEMNGLYSLIFPFSYRKLDILDEQVAKCSCRVKCRGRIQDHDAHHVSLFSSKI